MSITTVTHINLRGDARKALEFYQSVFGGHLVAVTYRDAHNVQNPEEADQLMWGQVTSADGFHVVAYDVPSSVPWNQGEGSYFVSVRGRDADEIGGYWAKLSEGSTVSVPLAPAAWPPSTGCSRTRSASSGFSTSRSSTPRPDLDTRPSQDAQRPP